jgi:hypothetical protein
MRTTKLIKWAAAGLMVTLLAGCSSTPDSVEDPLSFDVDAQLPFVTAAPEAVAATPTPQPTAPWDTSAPTQDWQDDHSADLGDQIEEGDLVNDTTVVYQQLSTGDSGSDVEKLQERLKELKYYTGAVDGRYGSQLATSVKRFQSSLGLDTTGIATDLRTYQRQGCLQEPPHIAGHEPPICLSFDLPAQSWKLDFHITDVTVKPLLLVLHPSYTVFGELLFNFADGIVRPLICQRPLYV